LLYPNSLPCCSHSSYVHCIRINIDHTYLSTQDRGEE
jgi:hypothetical protein